VCLWADFKIKHFKFPKAADPFSITPSQSLGSHAPKAPSLEGTVIIENTIFFLVLFYSTGTIFVFVITHRNAMVLMLSFKRWMAAPWHVTHNWLRYNCTLWRTLENFLSTCYEILEIH